MVEPNPKRAKVDDQYRINRKACFATWSNVEQQCDPGVCLPTMLDFKELIFSVCSPAEWIVCEEHHQDNSIHFHAVWRTNAKMDIKDAQKKLTLTGIKPSLEKPRELAAAFAYCEKESTYMRSAITFSRDGFRRQIADHQAYELHLRKRRRSDEVFPFNLPDGQTQCDPGPSDKKCNWLIIAPPDSGKSRWAGELFKNKAVYYPSGNTYPWEGYLGERIIIYDDFYPTRSDLVRITAYNYHDSHVPGNTRYVRTHLPECTRLSVIILHNNVPEYAKSLAGGAWDDVHDDNRWFHARFSTIIVDGFDYGQ